MTRPLLHIIGLLIAASSVWAQSDLAPLKVTTNIAPSPGFLLLAPNCRISPRPYGAYLGAYNVNGGVIKTGKVANYPFEYKVFPDGRLGYSELVVFAGATVPAGVYIVDTLFQEQERLLQQRGGYLTVQHDLQMLPNGHRVILGSEDVTIDMSKVVPNGHPAANVVVTVIQEIDCDGKVVAQWRALDHIPVTESYEDLTAPAIRYSHNNSLWIDDDGNWIVSLRHMSQVVKVNRITGEIMWALGGKSNQFAFIGDHEEYAPTYFSYQHDARRLPNGNISLFDNGTQHQPMHSRGVEYKLDEVNKTATMVWEYRPQPDIYVSIQGGLQTLPDGHRLLGWGSAANDGAPGVTEVDSVGNVVFEAYYPKQMYVYRATKVPFWPTGRATVTAQAKDVLTGETYRYYKGQTFVGLRTDFTTLESFFYNTTTARRFMWSPKNPLWTGEAPSLKQARVDFACEGIRNARMTMRFHVDTLELGVRAREHVVYHRPVIDSGRFTPLPTRWDPITRELVVEDAQPGEFCFGIPTPSPGAPRVPRLQTPISDEKVLMDSSCALRVIVPGRSDSLRVQVSLTRDMASPIIDVINQDDRATILANGPAGRRYWRARAKTGNEWSAWSVVDSFMVGEPYIRLVKPATDVKWMHDSAYAITWQTNIRGSVRLELMLGDYVIAIIRDSVPAAAQGYLWRVPVSVPVTKDYRIRITPRNTEFASLQQTGSQFVEIVALTDVAEEHIESVSAVTAYPQPATSELHLENFGSGIRTIRMYAISGEQVLFMQTSGTRATIDVQQLPSGIYTMMVEDYLGRVHRVRAVLGTRY
ncbi:MAG: T9SS type A sorting domain-containing protein [Ignavibacteria bacterium]|nr:T9SS type A sorting domain-containing protein [Ignavibacteria bacterium]